MQFNNGDKVFIKNVYHLKIQILEDTDNFRKQTTKKLDKLLKKIWQTQSTSLTD